MAKLNAAKRKKIPTSEFGLPEKKAYPLENANHARNALARASQFATPDEEAEIKAKVAKRFPGIKQGGK